MATQVEISTVSAVKAIRELKKETKTLTTSLKQLSRTATSLNKKLGVSATKKLGQAQQRAGKRTRTLSAEMVRQKNAVSSARRQWKAITQDLQRAGASGLRIKNLERSLAGLESRMLSGKLTAAQYAKGVNRFKDSASNARRHIKTLRDATQGVSGAQKKGVLSGNKLSLAMRNLGSSAIFAVGPLSGIGARLNAMNAIIGRSSVILALGAAAFVGLTVAIFKSIKGIITAGREYKKIIKTLKIASGSLEIAKKDFRFLEKEAKRLGVALDSTTKNFAQLRAAARGTSISSTTLRKIFTGLSEAATVLELSADETAGAFRALIQMISKGTVQAEELRGQFGERIPGAFGLAAGAMGKTTEELGDMLKRGEVLAEDLLPLLAEELHRTFGPGVPDAVKSISSEVNKLGTAFSGIGRELDRITGFTEKWAALLKLIREPIEAIRESLRENASQDIRNQIATVDAQLNLLRNARNRGVTVTEKGTGKSGGLGFFADLLPDKVRGAIIDLLRSEESLINQRKELLSQLHEIGVVARETSNKQSAQELAALAQSRAEKSLTDALKDYQKETENANRVLALRIKMQGQEADKLEVLNDLNERFSEGFARTPQKVGFFQSLALENLELERQLDLVEDNNKEKLAGLRQTQKIMAKISSITEKRDNLLQAELVKVQKLLENEAAGLFNSGEKVRQLLISEAVQKDILKAQKQGLALTEKEIQARTKVITKIVDAKIALKDLKEENKRAVKLAKDFGKAFTSALEKSIVNLNNIRDIVRALEQDLIRLILRATFLNPLEQRLTSAVSGGGGIAGFLSSLFGFGGGGVTNPGTALARVGQVVGGIGSARHGGRISGPTVVGEAGRELFVPDVRGRVVSNQNTERMLGRAPVSLAVHVNSSGDDAESVRRNANQTGVIISRHVTRVAARGQI